RLADGLAHAHERGILHCDLKPANVLLADDGQPMLLDFNLAADVNDPAGAAVAQVGGPLPYMPPGLLTALAAAGPAATGRAHPFAVHRGPAPIAVPRMSLDRRTSPNVRTANPAVPYAAAAIVAKCLDPEPGRRYQSARQLQEDLQRQLDQRP